MSKSKDKKMNGDIDSSKKHNPTKKKAYKTPEVKKKSFAQLKDLDFLPVWSCCGY